MARIWYVMVCSTLVVGFGIELASACDKGTAAWRTMSESHVILRSDEGASHNFPVKVAVTSSQRRAGFQFICSEWVQSWGILFVYSKSQRETFHMYNVWEDLDIAFFSEDGRFLELKRMVREDRSGGASRYRASQPYQYALELAAGRLTVLGLTEGFWNLIKNPAWTQTP